MNLCSFTLLVMEMVDQLDFGKIYYYVNGNYGWLYVNQTDFDVSETRANGLVPAGKYDFDRYGRLVDKLIPDGIVKNLTKAELSTEIIGRVLTFNHTKACGVGYLNNGVYVALEALPNAYGSGYSYAVPAGVAEVVIVLRGDVNGDGKIETTDIEELKNVILETEEAEEVSEVGKLAGDVNGDGKLTALDLALINAVAKGKANLDW